MGFGLRILFQALGTYGCCGFGFLRSGLSFCPGLREVSPGFQGQAFECAVLGLGLRLVCDSGLCWVYCSVQGFREGCRGAGATHFMLPQLSLTLADTLLQA